MRIGHLGVAGSYSHAAATVYYDVNQTFVSQPNFRELFKNLNEDELDRIVIPIENTLAGSIYENYDLLASYPITVLGETTLRIEHCLLSQKPLADLDGLRKVYSHPKALEQCSDFLSNYPAIESIASKDTASAAEMVSQSQDGTIAAIASKVCAELYGLHVSKQPLENNSFNFTRFLIVGDSQKASCDTAGKCSIILRLPHKRGSLSTLLVILTDSGCNLTKLESRPIQDVPFEYSFYIDFTYDSLNQPIDSIILRLQSATSELQVLGTYKPNLIACYGLGL